MPDSRTEELLRSLLLGFAGILVLAGFPAMADAKVFHARDEALKLAFPDADRVETRDVVLTAEQHQRIEALAKAPLDSDLVTIYVGWKGGDAVSYGIFDTHTVRTFPETFLVVIGADGKLLSTQILAFHEPEEYLPSQRWLDTFHGKSSADDLRVGSGVVAIAGATLSTNAVTSGIRRVLAIWSVLIGGK